MADHTHIEWTDATWNPITGCSVVSAGCKHCYAMKLAGTRLAHHPSRAGLTIDTAAGPVWNGDVRFNEDWLDQPLRWRRPRRIFVCAHGDLFHESVPDEWICAVFAVMAASPHHTYQVLTKRPARVLRWFERMKDRNTAQGYLHECLKGRMGYDNEARPAINLSVWPLPNVWLGVSVENQAAADERIPVLLQCPAVVRWVSAEPLLGPIDLDRVHGVPGCAPFNALNCRSPQGSVRCVSHASGYCFSDCAWRWPALDWVVVGGESGAGARPLHPDWVRSLRDQCAAAGVPFLFKQWGEWAPAPGMIGLSGEQLYSVGGVRHAILDDGYSMARIGKKAAGRLLDGVEHNAFPEVHQ